MEVEERRKIGLKYLKTIDGEVGDEVIKALDGVAGDIGNYILEFAFGEIYNRKSLNLKQREMITITSLLSQGGTEPQLKVHINEISRGGVSPANSKFGILSRRISVTTDDYYSSPNSNMDLEELVTISIDTWTGLSLGDKTSLVNQLTQYFATKYKISGDNIVIYIREITPENWFQNGISGRNPEFLNKSREVK